MTWSIQAMTAAIKFSPRPVVVAPYALCLGGGTEMVLHAARRLYVRHGFKLIREEKHHSFGHDLVGEYWELAL